MLLFSVHICFLLFGFESCLVWCSLKFLTVEVIDVCNGGRQLIDNVNVELDMETATNFMQLDIISNSENEKLGTVGGFVLFAQYIMLIKVWMIALDVWSLCLLWVLWFVDLYIF